MTDQLIVRRGYIKKIKKKSKFKMFAADFLNVAGNKINCPYQNVCCSCPYVKVSE